VYLVNKGSPLLRARFPSRNRCGSTSNGACAGYLVAGGGGGQRASRGRLIDIFSTLESIHVSRRDQREGGSGEGGGNGPWPLRALRADAAAAAAATAAAKTHRPSIVYTAYTVNDPAANDPDPAQSSPCPAPALLTERDFGNRNPGITARASRHVRSTRTIPISPSPSLSALTPLSSLSSPTRRRVAVDFCSFDAIIRRVRLLSCARARTMRPLGDRLA
jgi:hypothetical protein